MSDRRFKLLKHGLPGGRNFEQEDLVNGDIPIWDSTLQMWTHGAGGGGGTVNILFDGGSATTGGSTVGLSFDGGAAA